MRESLPSDVRVAIVGASGAVGTEALSVLRERGYCADQISCYGSERSAGSELEYADSTIMIRPLEQIRSSAPEYALLCADAPTAHRVSEMLEREKTVLIDNSSAFRMDPRVPLVVPEVNAETIVGSPRLIANPNCSTIMLVRAIDPIKQAFGLESVTVTTYQAVSGAGRAGIDELFEQTSAEINGKSADPKLFPVSCAFNVFEHESPIDPETGFNGEETKMIKETRRILNDPDLRVFPTCVRVPVERAHAQSIILDLDKPTSVEAVREQLIVNGVSCCAEGFALTPRYVAGTDDVRVGRVRIDPSSEGRRVVLWICCDQIRKGAALNAIQIMEHQLQK